MWILIHDYIVTCPQLVLKQFAKFKSHNPSFSFFCMSIKERCTLFSITVYKVELFIHFANFDGKCPSTSISLSDDGFPFQLTTKIVNVCCSII